MMRRVVVTGLGAVTPLANDEPSNWEAMLAEAGQPVGGRPTFTMVGNQIQMMASAADLGNIRITIRPPIDRAGQQVAASWTTTRGFPVYCNLLSGQSAGRAQPPHGLEAAPAADRDGGPPYGAPSAARGTRGA